MSFIERNDGLSVWTIVDLSFWRATASAYMRSLGINPRILLYGHDDIFLYETQDPLFGAIFAPKVRTDWQLAKTEIDGLVKIWTVMSAAVSDYSHWFMDPQYYESFSGGIRDQLRRIYVCCGHESAEADRAFDTLVATLLNEALKREEGIAREPVDESDDYDGPKEQALMRAKVLVDRLNRYVDNCAA